MERSGSNNILSFLGQKEFQPRSIALQFVERVGKRADVTTKCLKMAARGLPGGFYVGCRRVLND